MKVQYSTLLFDADNTLLDFSLAEATALAKTLEECGLPNGCDVIKKYSEINASLWRALERGETNKVSLRLERFKRLCSYYAFDVSPERVEALYTERLSECTFLMNEAEETCRALSKHCRMYVITNGLKNIQSRRFAESGLSKYFIKSFISEDVGADKPSKLFFDALKLEIPDFNIKSTLVIGDSLTSDIKGGIDYGIDTCWFNKDRIDAPKDMKITYTVERLSEIIDIVLDTK